jgi:aquaporin Z
LGPRLIAEFIGTFFLVVTVCAETSPKIGAGPLAPLAIGAILMAMVFAGGHVSGGHYNPAVSLAVMIRGKLTAAEWLGYAMTQLAAAAAGGVAARGIVGSGRPETTANTGKVLLVELLFTFALAYVVLSVATARAGEGNSYFGLAIGFTVAAGAFAVGGISGGAFNPAVALGASILGRFAWNQLWICIVATLAGASIGAVAFLYVQPSERTGHPDMSSGKWRPSARTTPTAATRATSDVNPAADLKPLAGPGPAPAEGHRRLLRWHRPVSPYPGAGPSSPRLVPGPRRAGETPNAARNRARKSAGLVKPHCRATSMTEQATGSGRAR